MPEWACKRAEGGQLKTGSFRSGLGFFQAAAGVLLVGCLSTTPNAPTSATAPPTQSSAAERPAAAAVDGARAESTPAAGNRSASAPTRSAQQSPARRLQAPFEAGDKEFAVGTNVDRRCAAASSSQGTLRYGGGACDSQGRVDGFGAASMGRFLIAEGVFLAGRFMPGAKYRTLSRYPRANAAVTITCSDMRPSDYDFPKQGGANEFVFVSTSATVCKEKLEGGAEPLLRKVHGGQDGAIFVKLNAEYGLRQEAQQHALLSDRDRDAPPSQLEVIGTAKPGNDTRDFNHPVRAVKSGTVRRVFYSDVYTEQAEGRSLRVCLEGGGPQACIQVDTCTLNLMVDSPSVYEGRPGCKSKPVGGPIRLNDGSIFTPATANGFGVFHKGGRIAPRGGPKTYGLGDAFDIVLIEGTLKSPNGREYSGRFVNGTPL